MRRLALICALAALVVAGFFVLRTPEETRRDLDPEKASRPLDPQEITTEEPAAREPAGTGETTTGPAVAGGPLEGLCPRREEEVRSIGDFAVPEGVPSYEVLEEEPVEREDVEAVRLLVDTRASGEAGYDLIARDVKAGRGDADAITIRFTDTTRAFDYYGSALIFNTPCGAYYMGFIYGPPNNDGYVVSAAGEE